MYLNISIDCEAVCCYFGQFIPVCGEKALIIYNSLKVNFKVFIPQSTEQYYDAWKHSSRKASCVEWLGVVI